MAAALSDDTPASNSYQAFFKRCIVRQSGLVLARVGQTGPLLPDDMLKQALLILGFALDLAEAWPNARGLLLQMAPKMEQAGFRDEWIPYLERGIYQSQQLGDLEAEAELQLQMGILCQLRNKYGEARRQLEASVRQFERLNAPHNRARALNRLAYVARFQRQFEEAAILVETACRLLEKDDPEWAYGYFVLGLIALDRRNWSEAVNFSKRAFDLWEQKNDQRMMGRCLITVGAALPSLKKYQEALTVCQQAIALFEETEDPVYQAIAQMHLGNVHLFLAQPLEALELYLPAERIFRQIQEQLRLSQLYNNIGIAYRQLRQWEKSEQAYLSSIKQYGELGNIVLRVDAMDGLGLVYLGQGHLLKAIATFKEALSQLEHVKGEPGYNHLLEVVTTHLREASAQPGNKNE
jgi:tetratricopeptide (TPR) repeat protein